MSFQRWIRIAISLPLAIGSLAGCNKPDPYVDVQALEERYARDEAGADRDYPQGVRVRGTIDSVTNGTSGEVGLTLQSDGLLPVPVSIVRSDWRTASTARPGQFVALSCRKLSEFLGKLMLDDCRIDTIGS